MTEREKQVPNTVPEKGGGSDWPGPRIGGAAGPFEIPTDWGKMTEQSMEQVRTAIDRYLQFFQRAVPGAPLGGNELSNKALTYAERNVANAFEFAQKLVQVKDVQDLVKLQTEFIQSQMQAMTEQFKDLSETSTKAVMDAVKGVGGPRGEGGASS